MATNYGLNDTLQYYEYYFDSLDAKNSKGGASPLDWPEYEMARPLQNVAAVKILEVQIPFTYYVFNEFNNTFSLGESFGNKSLTVTLIKGNYNSSSILIELMRALNAASVAGGNGFTYTVTYNLSTSKLTFTKTGTGIFFLGFGPGPTDNGATNPRLWLGFNGGTLSSTGNTLIAPNVLQITGPDYLYVNSYTLGPLCAVYLPYTTNGNDNATRTLNTGGIGPQMAKIPVTCNPGGVIQWQDPDPQKWFDLENLTNFVFVDFYLGFGNSVFPKPLSLNGGSISLKLGVLINSMTHNDVQSGLLSQDRVVKRIRPY